jgi:putative transposase
MPDYRRLHIPDGTVFFTVVTHDRRPFLTDSLARDCLREAIEKVRRQRPFTLAAMVLLPDHLHAIWTLPDRDGDYSVRWRLIKQEFTELYLARGGREGRRSPSRMKRKERGVWQRRFWDHVIRDEHDLERHFDYLHYNPVKHGLVRRVRDWKWSTFHRYVREGIYPIDWGSLSGVAMLFEDLDETAKE